MRSSILRKFNEEQQRRRRIAKLFDESRRRRRKKFIEYNDEIENPLNEGEEEADIGIN